MSRPDAIAVLSVFFWGVLIGLALSAVIHFFLGCEREDDFQEEAIAAGCGHYDTKTGEFTWGAP